MRLGVLRATIIALALTLSTTASLFAQEKQTSFSGAISGRELCEQAVCGSAIFVAAYAGQIDMRPAVGLAIGSIRHTALPTKPGDCATIVGGSWSINTLRRALSGTVEPGGTVCYINGVQFQVSLTMNIGQDGSEGHAELNVILDHGPFPPTVKGTITP